jgi:16S rRNA (guanine527-N7)-methyltransferase
MSFSLHLAKAAEEYGLSLTEKQMCQFDQYYHLLIEWNEKMNLTAITDPQEVAVKHIIDSLSCYKKELFSNNCSVIDVGTGAGFPGLPLKIFRSDIKLTLLDSLQKRTVFLRTVTEKIDLDEVKILHSRAEEDGQNKAYRGQYQIALSRAVARLNVLSELCLPFVAVGGYFIALKGAQYQEEIEEAQKAITLLGAKITEFKPVVLPGLEDKRAVIYIHKNAVTPSKFPRRPGIPEKKPL